MKKHNSITIAVLDLKFCMKTGFLLVYRHIVFPLILLLLAIHIMQPVPTSKQVNRVNIEPEILHGNWSSYWKYIKYNFFVNPFISCKTDIIICNNTL